MNLGRVIHLNRTGICIICTLIFLLFVYTTWNRGDDKRDPAKSIKINLGKLLRVAIKAAENGGKEVVQTKDSIEIKMKGLTKEGLVDSVTTADFLSHCSMIGTLKYFFPLLNVISEEADTKCHINQSIDTFLNWHDSRIESLPHKYVDEKDLTIWIDPLDATHEYTEKLYKYVTTMVCVAVKGKPIIGVIHKPFSNITSWAWVNKAKSKDLDVQKYEKNHESVKIIVSRSHGGEITKVLEDKFGKDYQVVIAAGAGFKALEVATRKVDAYLHITAIKKWDICAGNAILNALGGKMTTKFNKDINYSGSDVNVRNEDGLIATLDNHDMYIGKL